MSAKTSLAHTIAERIQLHEHRGGRDLVHRMDDECTMLATVRLDPADHLHSTIQSRAVAVGLPSEVVIEHHQIERSPLQLGDTVIGGLHCCQVEPELLCTLPDLRGSTRIIVEEQ